MPDSALPESKTNQRILVVDHDVAIREFLTPILSKAGCEVCALQSSVEAVSQAPHFRPDTLIIEPIMSELDGVRAAKQIVEATGCRVFFLESSSVPTEERERWLTRLRDEIPNSHLLLLPVDGESLEAALGLPKSEKNHDEGPPPHQGEDPLDAWDRQDYQESPSRWLREQFESIRSGGSTNSEWHTNRIRNEIKSAMQNLAESLSQNLTHTRDTQIFWLGGVAIIALASARLWLGAFGVVSLLAWLYWRKQRDAKMTFRLHRFRARFQELINKKDNDMHEDDRKFLDKYSDTILFPLALGQDEREAVDELDLQHFETLYREYCWNDHMFFLDQQQQEHNANCELCKAALRVRENFKTALSRYKAEIESNESEPKESFWEEKTDKKYYVRLIRRITERRNPEALFGDLLDLGGMRMLEKLKKRLAAQDFDTDLLREEMVKLAPHLKQLLGTKRGPWQRAHDQEMEAALAYALAEQQLRNERYKELRKLPLTMS